MPWMERLLLLRTSVSSGRQTWPQGLQVHCAATTQLFGIACSCVRVRVRALQARCSLIRAVLST